MSKTVLMFLAGLMMLDYYVYGQQLSQEQIDEAMKAPLINNYCGPDIDTELWTEKVIGRDKALFYLALAACMNPEASSTDGKPVADRVADHLKNILKEDSNGKSREPSCRGDLAGWKDIGQVLSLVLAKENPEYGSNSPRKKSDDLTG